MQKRNRIHSVLLTLLITGSSLPAWGQTPVTDFTQDLPSISTTNLDPAQVQELSAMAMATQGDCYAQDYTKISRTDGVPYLPTNLTLRPMLMFNNLDSSVDRVTVECYLLAIGQPFVDTSKLGFRFDFYERPNVGASMCKPEDLAAATLVDIKMYVEEGHLVSENDRYQCVVYLTGDNDDGSVYKQLPSNSIDAPDWQRAQQGSELVTELKGPIAK